MMWIIKPLNRRVLAMLVIWLILTDWALNTYLDQKIVIEQQWRINNPDLGSLQVVFDRIADASGIVVVCLGDSEIFGSSTPSAKTIPAYLRRDLQKQYPGQKVSVFNLGIEGLKPAEAYYLVHRLAQLPVDALIYNVSSGWFNSKDGLQFEAAVQLAGMEQDAARRGIKLPPENGNTKLGSQVARYWDFYRYRQVVSRDFFHLQEKIASLAERVQSPASWQAKQNQQQRIVLNWREKPELLPKGARQSIDSYNLTSWNLQWQLYLAMLDEWQKTNKPAVFYLTPANWELLEKKYMLDYPTLRADYRKIMETTTNRGIVIRDYTQLVKENKFTDEIHLQAEGNQQVAAALAGEFRKISLK